MSKQTAVYVLEAISRYWNDHKGDLQGPAHADRRAALSEAHVELTRIARAPDPSSTTVTHAQVEFIETTAPEMGYLNP